MRILSLIRTIVAAFTVPRLPELSDHLLRDIGLPERGPRPLRPELTIPVYNG
jgi:uncharacterized protein YjiS (DUF1127 family)